MARVHIGVPTYNGVDFIEESLACIQEQSFNDFEVLISDNGSNDGTSEICAAFAARDRRFKHVRFEETVPAGDNFRRVRDMATAEYFMWRSDDDLSDRNFLSAMVDALDKNPNANLAVCDVRRVKYAPRFEDVMLRLPVIDADTAVGKIEQVMLGCHVSWYYGLWRREAIVRDWDFALSSYPYLWASDFLAMLPSILEGGVALVQGTIFNQRIYRAPNYRLSQEDRLRARAIYLQIARGLVTGLDIDDGEKRQLDRALVKHVENVVAPLYKTYKRLVFKRLLGLIGVESDRYR